VAYTRTYRTVIPVDPDTDLDVLRWLTRESFERKAEGDALRIIDYTEGTVPAEDIPPKVGKQLGRPVTTFQWYSFEAKATNETGG
jgi:hypothetical protein